MGWNKGPAGGLCGGSDQGIRPYVYVRFAIFLFIGEISILLENFNFDTEWGKIKVPKWGNWATLGPKRPQVGAADKPILEVTGLYNIFKGSKLLIKMGWNLLSVAPGLLREESNTEETCAIFANSGKFAKVWCREIFYFREFAKVYSREKSLFAKVNSHFFPPLILFLC